MGVTSIKRLVVWDTEPQTICQQNWSSKTLLLKSKMHVRNYMEKSYIKHWNGQLTLYSKSKSSFDRKQENS
ncbi:hypothetical protein L596_021495 [Steinernema carpocapsae]|uniref:Uncharacterized protein n=1 Tax=Steinernema carpocapsae TaxID=34508 RepID=A0A4U5MIW9_STECR|nr:hypothetical protein L596_021495 [Steinernema carpocapsae]